MTQSLDREELSREVRALYRSDHEQAGRLIEDYLGSRLGDLPLDERLKALDHLRESFPGPRLPDVAPVSETSLISELFSLILGKHISQEELGSREILEKLAASLNTVFDTLNELICIIQSTFAGSDGRCETIRHVIGSQLEGGTAALSLESYVNQIKEAFLITHGAFKQAVQVKVIELLKELDPELLEEQVEGGLSFGPFRRAGLYDAYRARFEKAKAWHQSGRFMDSFLREFERSCQKSYTEKGG